ncbi:MAG: two-component system response regulator [Candidatus Nanohaloarchaea archaeon]
MYDFRAGSNPGESITLEKVTSNGITVLHLDDDSEFLELFKKKINDKTDSIEIIDTDSPERALEIIEEEEIDCVISDYEIPGMDGIEFMEEVRGGKHVREPHNELHRTQRRRGQHTGRHA